MPRTSWLFLTSLKQTAVGNVDEVCAQFNSFCNAVTEIEFMVKIKPHFLETITRIFLYHFAPHKIPIW